MEATSGRGRRRALVSHPPPESVWPVSYRLPGVKERRRIYVPARDAEAAYALVRQMYRRAYDVMSAAEAERIDAERERRRR